MSDDNITSKVLELDKVAPPPEGYADYLKYLKRIWLLQSREIEAYGLNYGLWFFCALCDNNVHFCNGRPFTISQ